MFNDRHAYILSKSFQTIKIHFKPIQTQNIINFLLDFFLSNQADKHSKLVCYFYEMVCNGHTELCIVWVK